MTARFYLVRHGRAEPKGASDASRRLSAEGRAAFTARATALAGRARVERIVTSPLLRARETAEILARATGASVEEEGALASGVSSGREILALGRRLGDGVALVGHNPEIAEAVALAAGRDRRVEPGAIAAVEADAAGHRLAWLEG